MTRWIASTLLAFALFTPTLFAPDLVLAEEPEEPRAPVPPIATDAQAQEALAAFEVAFKAKGLKGDEKLAAQEVAAHDLGQVQHKTVTDRLAKLLKSRDEDVRTLGTMYLGAQRALPGYSGQKLVDAMTQNATDGVIVMTAVEALADLDYRGAVDRLRALLASEDDFVKKTVFITIGDMKEMRLIEDVVKMMKDLKIDEGAKWEGGEVHYDSGASGDHDQKTAEKMYQDKYGSNSHVGKSAGRKMRDMGPILLDTMKALTGDQFTGAAQARKWLEAHKVEVDARIKELNDLEKKQRAEASAKP